MSMLVSVAQPGRQHCRHTCEALAEGAALSRFYTSLAFPDSIPRWLAVGPMRRVEAWQLPKAVLSRTKQHRWPHLVMSTAVRLGPSRTRIAAVEGWLHEFDSWAARQMSSDACDVVIGYENSSAETFAAAKSLGKVCVLEAASFHHAYECRFLGIGDDPVVAERNRRKDVEMELADRIVTLSRAAYESYREAGVDEARLGRVELGVDARRFVRSAERRMASEPFRVAFVGTASKRKGFDVLLEAMSAWPIARELWCVGDREDAGEELPDFVRWLGFRRQSEIPSIVTQCDVLALPSRFDAFGMAAIEAMTCGVPVVVSRNVGAADLVVEASTGWVVEPGDTRSLRRALEQAYATRGNLATMGARAARAVGGRSWAAYGAQIREQCRIAAKID